MYAVKLIYILREMAGMANKKISKSLKEECAVNPTLYRF